MFIGFGVFFMIWALTHYQMGSVRMGPAYFPTVLGGLLLFLGVLVLIESFAMEGPPLKLPFNIVHLIVAVLVYVVLGWIFKQAGIGGDYGSSHRHGGAHCAQRDVPARHQAAGADLGSLRSMAT